MPRKIFITGGFGFLGQHIVQALHDAYPESSLLVQARSSRVLHLPVDRLERVSIVRADLKYPEDYAAQLEGVDTLVHSAAVVSFRKVDREKIIQSNVVATRVLAEQCARHQVRDFIFISSISAVGLDPPRVSDESLYPDLEVKKKKDAYGYSKLRAEQELAQFNDRMRVVSLNPSVILGPGSRIISRLVPVLRRAPFVPMLSFMNSFVDVRDVASAVVRAIEQGRSGERYIITAWNLDMLDFIRAALSALGREVPVVRVSRRLLVPGNWLVALLDLLRVNPGIRRLSDVAIDKVYSNEKARLELGWEPQISLSESLKDTIGWE